MCCKPSKCFFLISALFTFSMLRTLQMFLPIVQLYFYYQLFFTIIIIIVILSLLNNSFLLPDEYLTVIQTYSSNFCLFHTWLFQRFKDFTPGLDYGCTFWCPPQHYLFPLLPVFFGMDSFAASIIIWLIVEFNWFICWPKSTFFHFPSLDVLKTPSLLPQTSISPLFLLVLLRFLCRLQ